MPVRLCLALDVADPETIADVLRVLVHVDLRLYKDQVVVDPPWGLRWIPDGVADTSTLRDVALLHERGYGSCGELACAYAAYVSFSQGRGCSLQLLSNGPDSWHVVAIDGDRVLDPQMIGGMQHGAIG